MKKKGFTLIELLAVIVILAIIALIATPIVLDIIEDSKNNSNLRSAENYLMSVKQSIANHQMKNAKQSVSGVYDVMKNGNLCKGTIDNDKCTGIEIKVQISGKKIMPSSITIGEDGDIASVEGLEINGKNYAYTNGSLKEDASSVICIANTSKASALFTAYDSSSKKYITVNQEVGLLASESGAYTPGVTYTCELGDNDAKTFFVLETNGDKVSLIMDRNFIYDKVWKMSAWCIDSTGNTTTCKNITSKEEGTPLKYIQDIFGTNVEVGIPSGQQIATVGEDSAWTDSNTTQKILPSWLYGYLDGDSNSEYVEGYWTSTPINSEATVFSAWSVVYGGYLQGNTASVSSAIGIRPVITLSKSQLG